MLIIAAVLLASIITGNSQAVSNVSNTVSGGSVQTKITTSANSETSTVTNDQPGTIKVTNINGDVKVDFEPTSTTSSTPTQSPNKLYPKINREKITILNYLQKFFFFIKRLLAL